MSNPTRLQPLVEIDATDYASSTSAKSSKVSPLSRVNRFLRTPAGMVILFVVSAALIYFAYMRVRSMIGVDANDWQRIRMMNPATGELRWHKIAGGKPPSGFYPVEYCFEGVCGPAGGTPVVLNGQLGKQGPTSCPKCNAPVTGHNSRPDEFLGVTPADQR